MCIKEPLIFTEWHQLMSSDEYDVLSQNPIFKNWHLQRASEEKGFKESSRLKDSRNFAVMNLAVDF